MSWSTFSRRRYAPAVIAQTKGVNQDQQFMTLASTIRIVLNVKGTEIVIECAPIRIVEIVSTIMTSMAPRAEFLKPRCPESFFLGRCRVAPRDKKWKKTFFSFS